MFGIKYSDYIVPDKLEPVEDLLRYHFDGNKEQAAHFIRQSGLKHIYMDEELSPIRVFTQLLDKFHASSQSNEEITHIIYTNPTNVMEDDICVPYLLQKLYKFDKASVIVMDQQCGSTLQSIQVAWSLLYSGLAQNVMILSLSCHIKPEDRFIGTTVVGDGAGLLIIGSGNLQAQIIQAGSLSNGWYSYLKYKQELDRMDPVEIVKSGVSFINDFWESNHVQINDVKLFIPQSINLYGYSIYASLLGYPLDKMFLDNVPNGGHLGDVDTIRNYTDAISGKRINQGDLFTLYGLGSIGMDVSYNIILLEAVS